MATKDHVACACEQFLFCFGCVPLEFHAGHVDPQAIPDLRAIQDGDHGQL